MPWCWRWNCCRSRQPIWQANDRTIAIQTKLFGERKSSVMPTKKHCETKTLFDKLFSLTASERKFPSSTIFLQQRRDFVSSRLRPKSCKLVNGGRIKLPSSCRNILLAVSPESWICVLVAHANEFVRTAVVAEVIRTPMLPKNISRLTDLNAIINRRILSAAIKNAAH